MEMSITSEMLSQQTICGDNESLELTNDMQYGKEKTELEGKRDLFEVLSGTENGTYESNSEKKDNDGDENCAPTASNKES